MKHKVGDSVVRNHSPHNPGNRRTIHNAGQFQHCDGRRHAYTKLGDLNAEVKAQLFGPLSEKEIAYRKDVVTALRAGRDIQYRKIGDQPAPDLVWRDLEKGETLIYLPLPLSHPRLRRRDRG